ncbi:hypothetical protein, partial [Micromonospora sp. NPDC023814]|uniref:hypothetical protein n=1 Tax=Micromonospora sp. NPDC023814 TaxID=3154596 RepID=UPI0033CF2B59
PHKHMIDRRLRPRCTPPPHPTRSDGQWRLPYYLALGRPDHAADAFRAITENPSAVLRRNQIYYSVQLASAAYRQGNLDEAAYTAMNLLPELGQVSSGRVTHHLAQIRSDLGQPQRSTAATRKFVEAYDQAVRG